MLKEWRADLYALLAASDPTFSRLRMALRVTLTLACVVVSLAALHRFVALPVAAYGVAIITAMQGALAIRDEQPAARAMTRLVSGLAGFAAVALASALSRWPMIDNGAFILLVFVAVYARKFGARWNAVGMFAFMCYFMGAYLKPMPADLPGVALAIAISAVISHVIRNAVLPERRAQEFARALLVVEQRVGELAGLLGSRDDAPWTRRERAEAIACQEQITETILIAEGHLPVVGIDTPAERGPVSNLAISLFDLHLACETALLAGLREGADDGANAAAQGAVDRLARLCREIDAQAKTVPAAAFVSPPGGAARNDAPEQRGGLFADPALRLAIQVSLASAIAMTGGLMLSKTRWFWAILTAFLVFTNTQSRGDTALRALNRAGGTVLGIVVGIALATLLHGQFAISAVLIVVFTFAGFYLLQISYAALTFFVTLVLSLLYGLIGQFTPELLILRLEETLIGVAAGVFIAFVVFPQTTSRTTGDAVDAFLAAIDNLLAAADAKARTGTGPNLVALSRLVDRRYGDLAIAARPLGSHWQIVQRPGRVRQTLLRFMALAHWSRSFARALTRAARHEHDGEALLTALAAVRAQVAEARRARRGFFGKGAADLVGSPRPEPLQADFSARGDEPLFCLDVVSHILDRAAHAGERLGRADQLRGSMSTGPGDSQ